ncbi:MAG: GTPase [Nanoarchaeota archaeon]
MSTNQSPEFMSAQTKYLIAKTDEEKLHALEEMIKAMPKHKSAESLRKNIRTRYKKLKEKMRKKKKAKRGREGIRKEGVQVVLIGLTSSGKSSLLACITNASPEIAPYPFTTKMAIIGALYHEGIKFQIIDMPAVNYETFDQGIANTADILLIIITNISDLKDILPFLEKSTGKRIIVFNKSDLLDEKEKRKIEATLRTRKYSFSIISCKTQEGIENLKQKLVENSNVIRVYTKQPHKPADKDPIIMPLNSTISEVAEKVLKKGIKVKEARITGPSSKFPNQKIGLKHKLKDKDIIEFHTF